MVRKGVCSKLQHLPWDLRVRGPNREQLKAGEAPGSHLKRRGVYRTGCMHISTSSWRAVVSEPCLRRCTHTQRQAIPCFVCPREEEGYQRSLKLGNTKPFEWSLKCSLHFFFLSCIFLLPLSSPTLSPPPASSWCPLNTVDCFLLHLITDEVCHA